MKRQKDARNGVPTVPVECNHWMILKSCTRLSWMVDNLACNASQWWRMTKWNSFPV